MSTTRDQYELIRNAAKSQSIHPSGIATLLNVNLRYARELVGVLHHQGFLDENEKGEFEISLHQTDEEFDEFLASNTPKEENQMTTATKKASPSKPKPASKASVTDCLCGCGDKVGGKANYKPGHDARHAGQVGKDIVANYATKGFDRRTVLAALPSDALKSKAEAIADRMIAKIETRSSDKK